MIFESVDFDFHPQKTKKQNKTARLIHPTTRAHSYSVFSMPKHFYLTHLSNTQSRMEKKHVLLNIKTVHILAGILKLHQILVKQMVAKGY